MIALIGRCQMAIRRFSGFPAAPCRAFDLTGESLAKFWQEKIFRCVVAPEKFFTLSFPEFP
jgi:hypothetical protein